MKPPVSKELLERYAQLKQVIDEAEKELDEMKDDIKAMLDEGVDYDIGIAKITLSKGKPRWVYTEVTTLREEDLKKTKKEEEQLGLATQVNGEPFITCRLNKKVVQ